MRALRREGGFEVTTFSEQFGFDRSEVNLANWLESPYSSWSFQNVPEIVPTAVIDGPGTSALPRAIDDAFLDQTFDDELPEKRRDYLDRTFTDAFLVVNKGKLISEYYREPMNESTRHLVFSVSKSITALLTGIVIDKYSLDVTKTVSHYLPNAKGSAYEDATIQDVLDMLVSVQFIEDYTLKAGVYARYRRAMLFMPPSKDELLPKEHLGEFLFTLPKASGDHGKVFAYQSPNTDVLGMILEKVTQTRFPTLLSELLWKPLGARSATVTVDGIGQSRTAGGIACAAHDLALLGELFRNLGFANGQQIVPERWIQDTKENGNPQAWNIGDFETLFDHGRYRNKWYSDGDGAYCGIGIHGQWMYVDPASESVIVKMSCQPVASDDELDTRILVFMRDIAASLR